MNTEEKFVNIMWYIRNYVLFVHWQTFIHFSDFDHVLNDLSSDLDLFATPFQTHDLPILDGEALKLEAAKVHLLINFSDAVLHGNFGDVFPLIEKVLKLHACGSIFMYGAKKHPPILIDAATDYLRELMPNEDVRYYESCEEAIDSLMAFEPRLIPRIMALPLPV